MSTPGSYAPTSIPGVIRRTVPTSTATSATSRSIHDSFTSDDSETGSSSGGGAMDLKELRRQRAAGADELMHMQQQFAQGALQPSVTVVRAVRKPKPAVDGAASTSTASAPAATRDVVSLGSEPGVSSSSATAQPAAVKQSKFKQRAAAAATSASTPSTDPSSIDSDTPPPFPASDPTPFASVTEHTAPHTAITAPDINRIPTGSRTKGFPQPFKVSSSTAGAQAGAGERRKPASGVNGGVDTAQPKKSLFAMQKEK